MIIISRWKFITTSSKNSIKKFLLQKIEVKMPKVVTFQYIKGKETI